MLPRSVRSPNVRTLARALCIALSVFAATPASAQAAPADLTPAQAQYRRAYDAMRDKNWSEARRLLLDLWSRSRTYDVAASLGQVEYQLQNYASGARYLSFAVSNVPPMEKPETVERFRDALNEIKKRVGTVEVKLEPTTAHLIVDGAAIETSERGQVFLNPGPHTFEARETGGNATAKTIEVAPGGTYALTLHVTSAPGGVGPTESATPPSSADASADASAAASAAGPLEEDGKSPIPVYVGAGVTVVSATLAIVFAINASSDRDDVNRYRARTGPSGCRDGTAAPSDCASADTAYDRQRRDATISNVAFGVSIGAAAGTLAYYLFWPKKTQSSVGTTLRPLVAVDVAHGSQGTLGLQGSF